MLNVIWLHICMYVFTNKARRLSKNIKTLSCLRTEFYSVVRIRASAGSRLKERGSYPVLHKN